MTRQLQRLVLSHGLSAAAMSMPWPALLAATWATTHSETLLGLVGAARMAPYVVLSWASGALGDRVSRTLLLLVSTRLRALLLALGALALKFDHLTAAVVLATVVVAVGTPAYPAIAAALPATAGAQSEAATSWLVTMEVSAFVVGPAVGGLTLSIAGAHASMLLAAGTAVFASALLSGVTVNQSAPVDDASRKRGSLAILLGCPAAVRGITAVAVINLVIGAVTVALLPLVERTWHGDEHEFGLVTAALGFGALAAPGVRRLLRLAPTAIRVSLTLVGLPLLLVAAAPTWSWALAPLLLLGAAATEVECVATTILQRSVPDTVRAFALGATDTVMVAGALVGATTAPWLAETVGSRLVFVVFAVVAAILVVAMPESRRIEQRVALQAAVHVTSLS